jgi:hypothetical protein
MLTTGTIGVIWILRPHSNNPPSVKSLSALCEQILA